MRVGREREGGRRRRRWERRFEVASVGAEEAGRAWSAVGVGGGADVDEVDAWRWLWAEESMVTRVEMPTREHYNLKTTKDATNFTCIYKPEFLFLFIYFLIYVYR